MRDDPPPNLTPPHQQPDRAAPGWRSWLDGLTGRAALVALALSVAAALALKPLYLTSLEALLGRTLFVGLVLLLVYNAAGLWVVRGVPRWAMQAGAVALAAPLAASLVYLLAVGGNLGAFFDNEALVLGFLWLAGTAIVLGLVLALVTQVREREARIEQQALRFALERSLLERQALDARLRLLQRQVEPHFLFNTLANVQALVASGSSNAEPLLGSLIRYLRAAMPRVDDASATLAHELARVRAYLELMAMRMPDRLRFSIDVAPAWHGLQFPPLGLLTLVENAVRHGVDPLERGGTIRVHALARPDGGLQLWVEDDGAGLAGEDGPVAGTGLANLRERLVGLWGPAVALELHSRDGGGVGACIDLPAAALAGPPRPGLSSARPGGAT